MADRQDGPVSVWIPAVPLPFQRFRVDECWTCGQRFRGSRRRARYEEHWVREHALSSDGSTEMLVPADHPFVAILREARRRTPEAAERLTPSSDVEGGGRSDG